MARLCGLTFGELALRTLVSVFDAMASLGDQRRPLKTHELRAVSLLADRSHGDKALPRPRRRFSLREHLRFGVDGITDEHRRCQLDVVPAEIADRLLADVTHAHAHHHRQCQAAIDQRLLELGLGRIDLVEVQGVGVHRQQGEPGIVAFGDRAAGAVLIDIADVEVIIVAAEAFAVALGTDLIVALHGVTPKLWCSRGTGRYVRPEPVRAGSGGPAPGGSGWAVRYGGGPVRRAG